MIAKYGLPHKSPIENINVGDALVRLDGEFTVNKIEIIKGAIRYGYRLYFTVRGREWHQIWYSGSNLTVKKPI